MSWEKKEFMLKEWMQRAPKLDEGSKGFNL
jgi:hypothetical protein